MTVQPTIPNAFRDPAVMEDPGSFFALLQSLGPVVEEPHYGTVMVTGYDEIVDVLTRKDGTISSATAIYGPLPPLPFEPEGDDISEQLEAVRDTLPWSAYLPTFDGEKHAEYRAIVTSLLTFSRIKANDDYVRKLTARLLTAMKARGTCEFVQDYSSATATLATCDLMGVPEDQVHRLLELKGASPSQIDESVPQIIGPDPFTMMKPPFDEWLRERQDSPRADLMSELANVRRKDGVAPDFDAVSCLTRMVFGAAQDTTGALIGTAGRFLAEDLSMQDFLRANPERIPDFLEECLRFDPPVRMMYKLVQKTTEIGGVEVKAGKVLALCLISGSHDPKQWRDPDFFDIDREGVRNHLGFGRGVHGCLGAPLGRMTARIALETLLAGTTRFSLSEAHHGRPDARRFDYHPTFSFRNLSSLHLDVA